MKKIFLVMLVLVICAGVVFAGGKKEEPAPMEEKAPAKEEKAPPKPSLLVYATTDKVIDMDPANAYDFFTWELFQNVYRGLMSYEPGKTTLIPGLAESYEVKGDGDVYVFNLRKGVTFTDGTPFTADTVKWSIDRVIALAGDPSWLVTDFVDSVEVVDDHKVQFNLKFPCGFFPSLVATVPYFPVNPNIYPFDAVVRDPEELKGGAVVGLGTYKIISFKRDEEIILEKNNDFYGKKANIDRIVIRQFADATTMRLALERGEVDLVYKSLNPSDIADLEKNSNFTTYKMSGPYIRYMCFETSEGVFKNKKLRQAFGALLNRKDIIDKVFLGQAQPLYSMVPNGMIFHTDDFKTVLGDGNVKLANQLLAEAGYSAGKPFEFELWYTPSHYGDTEVNLAEVVKANLEKSPAMKVTIKSAEWATYRDQWSNKQMPVFFLGWYPDYIDPDNYTAAFAGTAGSAGLGIFFSNPEWDALFMKEQSSPDPKVREEVFKELQMRWTDECPTVPIFQAYLYVFTKPNVKNVKIGPTLIFNYDILTID
jgi:peptide/nickel transport system substrate-binding protein